MTTFRNRFVRLTFTAVILALVSLLSSSCSAVKKAYDIEVTSFKIKSLSPNGLKSVDAVLTVGVYNPTIAFKITEIDGTVLYNGEPFATYSGGPISVDRKSTKEYDLPCSLTLSPSFSLFTALRLVTNGSLDGLTTDVTARVSLKGGLSKTLTYTDMPIQDLLDSSEE